MDNVIEFDGLKIRMERFRFRNTKEMNKFFDEALIESSNKFCNLNDQMIAEKMHVYFSWMTIYKFLSFVFLFLVFISIYYDASQWVGFLIMGISIWCFIRSRLLLVKLNKMLLTREFFKCMAEDITCLDDARQELIDKKKI